MTTFKEIKSGTLMKIIRSYEIEDKATELPSTFEELLRNRNVLVYTPIIDGNYIQFTQKEKVKIYFTHLGGREEFIGSYVKSVKRGGIQFSEIQPISDIVRIQKRSDFRLETSMTVKIGYTAYNGNVGQQRIAAKEYDMVTTSDISGGGISFYSNHQFRIGDKVTVFLTMNPKEGETELNGEVMRVKELDPKTSIYKLNVGLKFDYRSALEKEKVVRYVFEIHRKSIRL